METVQFGKYEASEEIGRGGMSIVYRGKHPTLNKDVAIKVLSEFLSGDKNFIKRFQEEAQLLSSFRHANIVSILDYGKQDSNYYIIMDLIEGFTVKQMILETGPLSLNIAANIIKNVATALAYTHRKSIIHQDIKSSNIMVDNNGRVLVTDFGLSRNISLDNTEANTSEIAGTLAYSAPEQLDRKLGKLDARTDIYSLGVVFYEMVTGKLPFADENTTVNIAYQHLNVVPESPKKLRPDLLLKSSSIIMKMLKKKQSDRYQTMEELLKDIRELEDVLQYYRPSEEEEGGSFFSFQSDDSDDSTFIAEESQSPIVFSSENQDEVVDIPKESINQSSPEREIETESIENPIEKTTTSDTDTPDVINPNDSDPFIGKELKHRYRIQKLVLRRILSRLYYAVDLVKDIPVTVQLPNESRPTFKTRINREIQTMRKINHPGFVKFLDIVEENGVNFVIREYVDGYTVKNLLKREQLSIKKSVQISLDVLDALSYLHKKGIIHRDLNSDVVIVPKKGRTRISSLGFTRVEDASSVSSGEFLGVVQYTAPEQITQSFSDVRTDIYAVGILLFEMLSGTPPFDSPLPVEVMDMHLKRVPRFPEESQKGIPLTLQRIVLKALSKQPEQRFQSAEEMTASLQNFLNSFTGKSSSNKSIPEGDSMDGKNTGSKKDLKENPVEMLSDTGIYKNIQVNKNQKKNVAFSIKKGTSAGPKKENKVDIHKIINNGLKTDVKKKEPPKENSKEREVYKATQVKKKNDSVGTSPTFTVKPSKKTNKKPIGPSSKKPASSDSTGKDKKKMSPLLLVLLVVIVGVVGYLIWSSSSQKAPSPEEATKGTLEWVSPTTPQSASLEPLVPLEISLKQPDYKAGNTFEVTGLPVGVEYELTKPDAEGKFSLILYTSTINPQNSVRFTLDYRNSTEDVIEKYEYSIANNTDTVKSILLNYENATYKINNGPTEEIASNVLIFKEKIYIPIRFLLNSLDGDLSYDFKEEKIVITGIDSHTYEFYLFKDQYTIDDSTITGVNPILEINDTAYLPIDFLGNRMHFVVVLERNLKGELLIHLLHNKEA